MLKFAFVSEEVQRLEREAGVYGILKLAGVRVSRVYGLFRDKNWHHDYESDVRALIMTHVGTSIEKFPQVTKQRDAGETTIINFAHSTINPPPRRLETETRELSELLLQLEPT